VEIPEQKMHFLRKKGLKEAILEAIEMHFFVSSETSGETESRISF